MKRKIALCLVGLMTLTTLNSAFAAGITYDKAAAKNIIDLVRAGTAYDSTAHAGYDMDGSGTLTSTDAALVIKEMLKPAASDTPSTELTASIVAKDNADTVLSELSSDGEFKVSIKNNTDNKAVKVSVYAADSTIAVGGAEGTALGDIDADSGVYTVPATIGTTPTTIADGMKVAVIIDGKVYALATIKVVEEGKPVIRNTASRSAFYNIDSISVTNAAAGADISFKTYSTAPATDEEFEAGADVPDTELEAAAVGDNYDLSKITALQTNGGYIVAFAATTVEGQASVKHSEAVEVNKAAETKVKFVVDDSVTDVDKTPALAAAALSLDAPDAVLKKDETKKETTGIVTYYTTSDISDVTADNKTTGYFTKIADAATAQASDCDYVATVYAAATIEIEVTGDGFDNEKLEIKYDAAGAKKDILDSAVGTGDKAGTYTITFVKEAAGTLQVEYKLDGETLTELTEKTIGSGVYLLDLGVSKVTASLTVKDADGNVLEEKTGTLCAGDEIIVEVVPNDEPLTIYVCPAKDGEVDPEGVQNPVGKNADGFYVIPEDSADKYLVVIAGNKLFTKLISPARPEKDDRPVITNAETGRTERDPLYACDKISISGVADGDTVEIKYIVTDADTAANVIDFGIDNQTILVPVINGKAEYDLSENDDLNVEYTWIMAVVTSPNGEIKYSFPQELEYALATKVKFVLNESIGSDSAADALAALPLDSDTTNLLKIKGKFNASGDVVTYYTKADINADDNDLKPDDTDKYCFEVKIPENTEIEGCNYIVTGYLKDTITIEAVDSAGSPYSLSFPALTFKYGENGAEVIGDSNKILELPDQMQPGPYTFVLKKDDAGALKITYAYADMYNPKIATAVQDTTDKSKYKLTID